MIVGEANGVKAEQATDWVGENDGKFNMLFQFEHIDLWNSSEFNLPNLKKYGISGKLILKMMDGMHYL